LASAKPKAQKDAAKVGKTRAGAVVLADSRLKMAISVVASGRMWIEGSVTKQCREEHVADEMPNAKHRQEHRARQLTKNTQLSASLTQKKGAAHFIELITIPDNLRV
jgi:hypothetical protein